MKTYIIDVDGTVADCSHRLPFIQQEKPDWDAFHEQCSQDAPIQTVIDVIRALQFTYPDRKFLYITGRMERNRGMTAEWLSPLGLRVDDLLMRKEGDHRKDEIIKPELLAEWIEKNEGHEIEACFEDRPCMVRKWREMGFTVFQMQHEEF